MAGPWDLYQGAPAVADKPWDLYRTSPGIRQSDVDQAAQTQDLTPPDLPPVSEVAPPQVSLSEKIKSMAEAPSPPWLQAPEQVAREFVTGIPGMVAQIPHLAYQGVKLATGTPQERVAAVTQAAAEGIPQGQQIAGQLQAPPGSVDWYRGVLNAGMLAAPAVEPLRELALRKLPRAGLPETPPEAPPVQAPPPVPDPWAPPEAPQIAPEAPPAVSTLPEAQTGQVPVPQAMYDPMAAVRWHQDTMMEAQPLLAQRYLLKKMGQPEPKPLTDAIKANQEKLQKGYQPPPPPIGEQYAAAIQSPGPVPQLEVRPRLGETPPLRGEPGGPPATQEFQVPPEERGYAGIEPAQPGPVTPPETGQSALPQEDVGISTKNAYTEAQRVVRGLPEVEQAARRDFGTVWDEAALQAGRDPKVGERLVAELNSKPRTISDTENAHLLRTQIGAQAEHSAAVDAVNNALSESDRTLASTRLDQARENLQDVYDATKRAGTKSGQALAARNMLAKEDYTLGAMEARTRAANRGQPLNQEQLGTVAALHEKITDLQNRLDAHEAARVSEGEFNKILKQTRTEALQAKGRVRFSEFMDRKAEEARARIIERRGRLTTGFDPTAITDEAIIGASHIARGLTKFADWSAQMIQDFGERVRPFLEDIWKKAKAFHDANSKVYKSPQDIRLERYKNLLAQKTVGVGAQIERGDFTKVAREPLKLDPAAFKMRANLQRLKNEFERGVAKEAYRNKGPMQKFWDHFVGVERAMKLSGPEVFGKLGIAAATREALAPIESAGGYAASKVFPRLARGTRYGADLGTAVRAELKAKAAMFTQGMKDAWDNVRGRETQLEAIGDKYGRLPDFWYARIGKMHAAIKAPVKRAEFTRSLELRMNSALKAGEDIKHPEVMARLANESVMDANRAIFQQNTIVSNFFSAMEKKSPVAGRVARFLFPVVKIPVNLFKELVTYHAGAPAAAARIGQAYWRGIETLAPLEREAIIRQLVKGSVGGAALLWGYYNKNKVRAFFDAAPNWFAHTPMAMVLNEGSYIKMMEENNPEGAKELKYMAATDIPFMYTAKDIGAALDAHNSEAIQKLVYNMTTSTTVPQISQQVAKTMDKPGELPWKIFSGAKPTYRKPQSLAEAIMVGIPGLRQQVGETPTHRLTMREMTQEQRVESRLKHREARRKTILKRFQNQP